LAAEITALINDTETAFLSLKAPIQRVTGFDVPVPMFSLEEAYLPSIEAVYDKIRFLAEY